MAILHQGILGGFSGKIGNIVGYRYNSKWCIRRSPSPSSKPATTRQLAHRQKFRTAIQIASPLREQLASLPTSGKKRLSAYNRFLGHLMRTALGPSGIDYDLLQITKGSLPAGFCHHMSFSNGRVNIGWCTIGINTDHKQEAVVNIYSPLLQTWASYCLPVDESREVSVRLPCDMLHSDAMVFMYFKTTGGKQVSDSIYLGNTHGRADFNSLINLN